MYCHRIQAMPFILAKKDPPPFRKTTDVVTHANGITLPLSALKCVPTSHDPDWQERFNVRQLLVGTSWFGRSNEPMKTRA
jgi:hypothetical protein